MTGREAIEVLVENERENAERELREFNGFERYADALTAEAALRDRRPSWVVWARARAAKLRKFAKQVEDMLAAEPTEDR